MSTAAGAPSDGKAGVKSPQSKDKGKGKSGGISPRKHVEEDDESDEDEDNDDDDDDEHMEEDDDDDEEEEEQKEQINPSVILGRRTRGIKVDYTSKEALRKAGFDSEIEDDDDDEEMKD